MLKELYALRKKIDSLDDHLIKYLKKRSLLIAEAAKLKESLHPKPKIARETLMAYRLLKKDFGKYDNQTMQKVWRELISSSLNIEGSLKVEVLANNKEISPLWIHARDHFGIYSDITQNPSLDSVLQKLNDNVIDLAIVPFPDENLNWWDYLKTHEEIKVSLTLPFLPSVPNVPQCNGILLSKAVVEQSVDDQSLFLVEAEQLNPLANIKIVLRKGTSNLVLINGFCKDIELVSKFVNLPVDKITYLGSYPKPLAS